MSSDFENFCLIENEEGEQRMGKALALGEQFDLNKNGSSTSLGNPFNHFDYREFLCGWGSAFINITSTYPIYKLIFRQVSSYLP